MFRIRADPFLAQDITEGWYFILPDEDFLLLEAESVALQPLQDCPGPSVVLLPCASMHDDVVDVDLDSRKASETGLNSALEC